MSPSHLPGNYRDMYCNTCKKYGWVNKDEESSTDSSEKPQKKLTKLEKFFKDGKVLKEHYETCKNKILSESND